ncbi:MAG TPA: rhomboid family intramembrane serine protease [Caulobacteraceae bacterium]
MQQQQQREPPFKGPWPVWTIAGAILLSYTLQSFLLTDDQALAYALVPADLARGHWTPLFTAIFIHGGWAHAGMNAVGAVAFGAPSARYLGLRWKGALGFFLLFLTCGVLASLGYGLLHLRDAVAMAGASGAVSGLLGAATRLADQRSKLSPLITRSVVASSAAWIVVNAVMGSLHYAPGIGDVQIAWEAHIFGYFAGLLLIGPFGALFGQRPPPPDPSPEDQGQDSDASIQSEV